ncbi:MAG: septal ring lytic transglycosylase RlpA family protein [Chloroflexota bacterium]
MPVRALDRWFEVAFAAGVGCLAGSVPLLAVPDVALAQRVSADESHNLLPMPELKVPLQNPSLTLSAAYETGVASTYGENDGFEGNLTACGQVFHTQVVQVAHKSLPCGTMIRIEDADTGRSIVAEVTDRGPYIPGRIVDLSWAAFRQLDPAGPGRLVVTLYLLDD